MLVENQTENLNSESSTPENEQSNQDSVNLSDQVQALKKHNETIIGEKKRVQERLNKAYSLLGISDSDNPDLAFESEIKKRDEEKKAGLSDIEKLRIENENLKTSVSDISKRLENEAREKKNLNLESSLKNVLSKDIKADKIDFAFKALKVDLQEDDQGFFAMVKGERVNAEDYAKAFIETIPELKISNQNPGTGGDNFSSVKGGDSRLQHLRNLRNKRTS